MANDSRITTTVPRYPISEYGPIAILSKSDPAAPDAELVVAGYASPQVMDREKHVITKEALAADLPRFMAHPNYRNANLLHSNVQVAEVLPEWIGPDGTRYVTRVDELGLFVVVKVRTDAARPAIMDKVISDIKAGKLASFSISADAPFDHRTHACADGVCFWVIDKIELYEITLCETPVNQDAKFSIISKAFLSGAYLSSSSCPDGSCGISALRLAHDAESMSNQRESGDLETPEARSDQLGENDPDILENASSVFSLRDIVDTGTDRANYRGEIHPAVQTMIDRELGKAGYNQPNTEDDEIQYLNLALLEKDNEANSLPPDLASGTVITGEDHPTKPKLSERPRVPRLQMPVSGSPDIIKGLRDTLEHTLSELNLSHHDVLETLDVLLPIWKGAPSLDWSDEDRLFKATPGSWRTPSGSLSELLGSLHKSALAQGNRRLATDLRIVNSQMAAARPLCGSQALTLASDIATRAASISPRLNKAMLDLSDPERALASVKQSLAATVRSSLGRSRTAPHILAALDLLYEDADAALTGLRLGGALGLSDGDADVVENVLADADAENTPRDVAKTDRLLDAVENKAQLPASAGTPGGPGHTGAMIAWYPTSGTSRQLALKAGEDADELHCTVLYLGDTAELTPEHRSTTTRILQQLCLATQPMQGTISGIGRFGNGPDGVPTVALVDCAELGDFHHLLKSKLKAAGVPFATNHGFTPHITLRYDKPGMDDMQERGIPQVEDTPISLDRLWLVWAGEKQEFSLDAGIGQVSGQSIQKSLQTGDADAVGYAALFERMWNRGFRDPRYRLALVKDDGGEQKILEIAS